MRSTSDEINGEHSAPHKGTAFITRNIRNRTIACELTHATHSSHPSNLARPTKVQQVEDAQVFLNSGLGYLCRSRGKRYINYQRMNGRRTTLLTGFSKFSHAKKLS